MTKETVTICHNSQNIEWGWLKKQIYKKYKIPKNAYEIRIFVRVPGGGDYSNMDLDLFEENIYITWKTQEVTKNG